MRIQTDWREGQKHFSPCLTWNSLRTLPSRPDSRDPCITEATTIIWCWEAGTASAVSWCLLLSLHLAHVPSKSITPSCLQRYSIESSGWRGGICVRACVCACVQVHVRDIERACRGQKTLRVSSLLVPYIFSTFSFESESLTNLELTK